MKKLFTLLLLLPLFVACGSDDNDTISLKETEKTLKSTETYQIKTTSNNKITYVAENQYHAKVSESGLVTAGKIGETNIVITDGSSTRKFKVTINPESTMYPTPNLEFGISKADLIKKLGKPTKETSDGISYDNFSTKAPQIAYLFDSSNKLKTVGVIVKTAYSSELGTYLNERYVYATAIEEEYTLFFMNSLKLADATMVVGANLYNTAYWMTIYAPYPAKSNKVAQRTSEIDKMNEVANVLGINK